MVKKGVQYWDFEALLGQNEGEITLSPSDITVYPLFRDDYLYTRKEILDEQGSLANVGLTERIVVERTADGYSLIGPLLPFLALSEYDSSQIPCIVRSGDLPQIQQVLSIRLNAEYTRLSPLVYSRLIERLGRLFPVMKAVSGMQLGIKREWIANILGISPSAVLRYAYISRMPEALQLRCNDPNFPYLCFKNALHFTDSQFRQLLEELIHYELRSRYIQISASELNEIIAHISNADSSRIIDSATDTKSPIESTNSGHMTPQSREISRSTSPALNDPLVENYYQNLLSSYEDRFDEDSADGTTSDLFRAAHRNGYVVPDETLREASYLLYCLSHVRLAGGQKLLDFACLKSISDSVNTLSNTLVL